MRSDRHCDDAILHNYSKLNYGQILATAKSGGSTCFINILPNLD